MPLKGPYPLMTHAMHVSRMLHVVRVYVVMRCKCACHIIVYISVRFKNQFFSSKLIQKNSEKFQKNI